MSGRLIKHAPLLTLVVLLALGAALSPDFLTFANLRNVVQYSAEIGILAVAMTLIIVAGGGGIDLSVGSTLALAGILAAGAQSFGVVGAVAVALAAGLVVGAINGTAITRGKVEPFMATLAMLAVGRAVTLWYSDGAPILGTVTGGYRAIVDTELLGVPLPAYYLLVIGLAGYVLLQHTRFGRQIYAIGGDEETARLAGIDVERVRFRLYVVAGLLAGLAGAITTARIGIGEPRAGTGYELEAIAAVIVGGTSLFGGRGTIQGTIVGVMILAVIVNVMNLLDVSDYAQPIIRGLVILVAAYLIVGRKGAPARFARRRAPSATPAT
jgi:ribose/xylose/arabinose/galactoside ABC-type transport system permease subunit